ncbi:MAG TPA: cytidine deaminase [Polyangiaceae bacterium]|jgi:cytidine deaminase|nr:cytidine deaminase [Polyangiaceae bacterium]
MTIDEIDETFLGKLIAAARTARAAAYAPYSDYRVGSAIATDDGRIFTGCNVENASYGATICAERMAIGAMVVAGASKPVAIAIVTGGSKPGSPCGMCRQVLVEFTRDMPVVLVAETDAGDVRRDTTLAEVMPDVFELE